MIETFIYIMTTACVFYYIGYSNAIYTWVQKFKEFIKEGQYARVPQLWINKKQTPMPKPIALLYLNK